MYICEYMRRNIYVFNGRVTLTLLKHKAVGTASSAAPLTCQRIKIKTLSWSIVPGLPSALMVGGSPGLGLYFSMQRAARQDDNISLWIPLSTLFT